MDYKKLCMDIFGTDEPEKLIEIAEKARKYEMECEQGRIVNERNAGRKPKIDRNVAIEIQTKYENGKSVVELAREYSISRPTVYKYLSAIDHIKKRKHIDDTTDLL